MKVKHYDNLQVFYRPGTTDEKVLKEVIEKRAYRRGSIGFDVEAGEHWLDLGANIGAFAVYCLLHGAKADCYEPDPDCFQLLKRNAPGCRCYQSAVSALKTGPVALWSSSLEGNHYRGTLLENCGGLMKKESSEVQNIHAGQIKRSYDGVKMDIEGSEFGIIDNGLLPAAEKLCFEYHTSRDKSMERLARRLDVLKGLYEVVSYTPELDRLISKGGMQRSFHDRVIYCMGKKKPPVGRRG